MDPERGEGPVVVDETEDGRAEDESSDDLTDESGLTDPFEDLTEGERDQQRHADHEQNLRHYRRVAVGRTMSFSRQETADRRSARARRLVVRRSPPRVPPEPGRRTR